MCKSRRYVRRLGRRYSVYGRARRLSRRYRRLSRRYR